MPLYIYTYCTAQPLSNLSRNHLRPLRKAFSTPSEIPMQREGGGSVDQVVVVVAVFVARGEKEDEEETHLGKST